MTIWALSLLTMELISHSLTPEYFSHGIRSLIEFGNLVWPLAPSVLYPRVPSLKASPKAISRRTSYLRVRLEFLRYPQLIPAFFNIRVVRTSTASYRRFILSMDRSPGFGSTAHNFRPLQTRSRFGSGALRLNLAAHSNSPARSTKSTRSLSLPLLVNIGFQVLFHSPPGVLFTFPSRYCFTIGYQVVFSLMGWSPLIHTRFHVPRITPDPTSLTLLSFTGLSPSMVSFPKLFY